MFEITEKLLVVLSLALVAVFGKTEVTVENAGYSVLVSFSQNVHSKDGKDLLDNMKASLKDASEILHNAIGLHFSKVTFKLPTSWDISELNITLQDSLDLGSSKTDFLIDGANDVVFGKLAFAQQYGSCSVPGKQIIIPTAFFDEENTFPKGITLAREWLKYRYGVFDENGYFEDPMYPRYYTTLGRDPNEVKITDCTNAQVTYNFLDQDGNNCSAVEKMLIERLDSRECEITPDKENVTSSLMYFQKEISTMQHICGKVPDYVHNSRSPNKQNILCSGQSIWDVVKQSPDFQQENTREDYDDIQYVYVHEPKPKVIVAWENTQYRLTSEEIKNKENKGPLILNAIKKFMIDLPNGSKFNGFPFKASLQTSDKRDYSLHDLNGPEVKRRIIEDISSDFVATEPGDINLAVSKALEIFQSTSSDSELEGTIVVITKSIGSLDETLLEKLKDSKICIMLMFFSNGTIPEEMESYASALPCATLEVFSMLDEGKDIYGKLFKAMEILLPSTVADKETETVKTDFLSEESSISFQVNDTVEVLTFWVFSKKESEYFVLKFNGKEEIAEEAGDLGSILALTYTPPTAGHVEFSYPHYTENMLFTDVRATYKTYKEGKYFNGEVFIHDTSEKESLVQMPVIIYAFIRFGAYPVQNAVVTAQIKGPDGNTINRGLSDEGKGDPDITKNDGIYSGYFTGFSEKGEYTVTVTVRNNDFTTYGADENSGYEPCCGSYVKGGTAKLAEFSKEFKTTFEAKSGRPDDGYKPLRILDLRIAEVTDDKVILKWTAPGGEADTGTASRYEVRIYCGEDNVTGCDIDKMVKVLNNPLPSNYGREQEVTIQIITFMQVISVGIVTINSNNKFSDLSNIIEIFRPIDNNLKVTTTTKPDTSAQEADSVGAIVGITVTIILITVCVAGSIIYYYAKRKPHYKKRDSCELEENMNTDNQEAKSTFKATDCSIKSTPVKKIASFPVILYTHDQIKDFKDKGNDPPLYKVHIPPKQWASLDVMSNVRTAEGDRDTKSLDSSSMAPATDRLEINLQSEIRY